MHLKRNWSCDCCYFGTVHPLGLDSFSTCLHVLSFQQPPVGGDLHLQVLLDA